MQDERTTWALVPIKPFAAAKSRLAPLLTAAQCAGLARAMTADVLAALHGCAAVDRVACLGHGPDVRHFAERHGAELLDETPDAGLLDNLDRAAARIEARGGRTLLVVPGDLPMLTPSDFEALLAAHRTGVTVCPARRDGGSNALVASPPTAIGFRFGEDSCRRHLDAARAAGLEHRRLDAPAFRLDIDVPDDLARLIRAAPGGETGRYLEDSGLAARLRGASGPAPSAAIA